MKTAAALLVLGLAGGAQAGNNTEAARAHVAAAYAQFQQHDFQGAITAFRRAYSLDPQPKYLLNIALSYGKLEDCAQAMATFDGLLEVCKPGCDLRAAAAEERHRLSALCTPTLHVESEPSGAQVQVAGVPRGVTPLTLRPPAGRVTVDLQAEGYQPATQWAVLEWKSSTTLKLALALSPDRSGQLELVDRPPRVGVTLNEAPLEGATATLAPGVARLVVTPPRGAPRTLSVPVNPGGITVVDLGGELVPPAADYRPWAWSSWGLSAAGLALGAVAHVQYQADLESERAAVGRSAVHAARDDAVRDALLTQVGYGVAVTGLVAGVLFWVNSDAPEPGVARARGGPAGLAWAF
jgi:hypothetical protein